ncbi:MAG: 3-dehydroquinate dehydratase [Muribaculaceae bacterium]|nr:3-dehydroquinate dehydratase [Muribaculaceae bacterium]MBR6431737.1 3-dehydroquinate dehydratase [Muribaculaceae bacterium]
MKISIINGPNLNMTGKREPEIYGTQTLDEYLRLLAAGYPDIEFTTFQSNVEGEIVNEIQRVGQDADGIVINAGAYSHYSIAIADALRAVPAQAVEVHISNILAREPERRHSVLAPACVGIITGFGLDSYRLAIEALDSIHST